MKWVLRCPCGEILARVEAPDKHVASVALWAPNCGACGADDLVEQVVEIDPA